MTVIIHPGEASLADWRAIWRGEPLAVDPSSHAGVIASAPRFTKLTISDMTQFYRKLSNMQKAF